MDQGEDQDRVKIKVKLKVQAVMFGSSRGGEEEEEEEEEEVGGGGDDVKGSARLTPPLVVSQIDPGATSLLQHDFEYPEFRSLGPIC